MAGADGDLRTAYLRLADPVGTPVRMAYMGMALGCVAAYGVLRTGGWVPRVVPWVLAAAAGYYAFESWRARLLAKHGTDEALRREFARKAHKTLDFAPSLPVRVALWFGLGAWAWVTVVRGGDYPLGGDRDMAVFLGGMGSLLGARYFYDWRVEIPALRRDLAALGITPAD